MSYKIAIIEDDLAISQMYRIKFESEGYKVETAPNGLLGLDLLKTYEADMVLLDLMMPQMGGLEMLTKLRDTPHGKKTKVVILTNIGEQEIPPQITKLEVVDIIAKAYHTPAQVVEKIKRLLLPK